MFDKPKFTELLGSLYPFMKKKLGLKNDTKVKLIDNENTSTNPLCPTGGFNPDSKDITLFTNGRHTKDVLRSFAHELVHYDQFEKGLLTPDALSDMGEGYAQRNELLRKCEEDAYLRGNMLFRDWEDWYKKNGSANSPNSNEIDGEKTDGSSDEAVNEVNYSAYHGSQNSFDRFDVEYLGSGNDQYGPGFYFATTELGSKRYGDVTQWDVRIDKPVSFTRTANPATVQKLILAAPNYLNTLNDFDDNPRRALMEAIRSYSTQSQFDAYIGICYDFYGRDNYRLFLANMIKLGFDGVIVKNNHDKQYGDILVAYDANKIKKKVANQTPQ